MCVGTDGYIFRNKLRDLALTHSVLPFHAYGDYVVWAPSIYNKTADRLADLAHSMRADLVWVDEPAYEAALALRQGAPCELYTTSDGSVRELATCAAVLWARREQDQKPVHIQAKAFVLDPNETVYRSEARGLAEATTLLYYLVEFKRKPRFLCRWYLFPRHLWL